VTEGRGTWRSYTLYIQDDRYSVPSLDAVGAENDAVAEAAARARLSGSPHYRAIEVWDGDRCVVKIEQGDPARRR
jgi:hypothetical protein